MYDISYYMNNINKFLFKNSYMCVCSKLLVSVIILFLKYFLKDSPADNRKKKLNNNALTGVDNIFTVIII